MGNLRASTLLAFAANMLDRIPRQARARENVIPDHSKSIGLR